MQWLTMVTGMMLLTMTATMVIMMMMVATMVMRMMVMSGVDDCPGGYDHDMDACQRLRCPSIPLSWEEGATGGVVDLPYELCLPLTAFCIRHPAGDLFTNFAIERRNGNTDVSKPSVELVEGEIPVMVVLTVKSVMEGKLMFMMVTAMMRRWVMTMMVTTMAMRMMVITLVRMMMRMLLCKWSRVG